MISHDNFDIYLAETSLEISADNLTYAKACQHPGWHDAMDNKMQSIYKKQTWNLVPLPPWKKAITTKWVYKTKPSLNGTPPRLKARLVARGFE